METTLSNVVVTPLRSPLGNLFFSNPSLLILFNLISFNTSIPFLEPFLGYLVASR